MGTKKPLYYIQNIGYNSEKKLLEEIQKMRKKGFVLAVDTNGNERVYSPQSEKGNWTAVLIKVKGEDEETWEEYKKRKNILTIGIADKKAKQKWKEKNLFHHIVNNHLVFKEDKKMIKKRTIDWYKHETHDELKEVPFLLWVLIRIDFKTPKRSEILLEKRTEYNHILGKDTEVFRVIWIQLYEWKRLKNIGGLLHISRI